MTELTKPAAPIDSHSAVPIQPKRFAGGFEPGTLHGIIGLANPDSQKESDESLCDRVKKMSGEEMRGFLRVPGNSEKYEAARARRRKQ